MYCYPYFKLKNNVPFLEETFNGPSELKSWLVKANKRWKGDLNLSIGGSVLTLWSF